MCYTHTWHSHSTHLYSSSSAWCCSVRQSHTEPLMSGSEMRLGICFTAPSAPEGWSLWDTARFRNYWKLSRTQSSWLFLWRPSWCYLNKKLQYYVTHLPNKLHYSWDTFGLNCYLMMCDRHCRCVGHRDVMWLFTQCLMSCDYPLLEFRRKVTGYTWDAFRLLYRSEALDRELFGGGICFPSASFLLAFQLCFIYHEDKNLKKVSHVCKTSYAPNPDHTRQQQRQRKELKRCFVPFGDERSHSSEHEELAKRHSLPFYGNIWDPHLVNCKLNQSWPVWSTLQAQQDHTGKTIACLGRCACSLGTGQKNVKSV